MKLMGNQNFSIHRQLWGHFLISRLTSILRLQVSMTFREMIRTPFSQADSKVHDVLWQSYDFHHDRTNVCGKSVTYKYLLQVSLKVVKSYKYHFGDLFVVLTFWCDQDIFDSKTPPLVLRSTLKEGYLTLAHKDLSSDPDVNHSENALWPWLDHRNDVFEMIL